MAIFNPMTCGNPEEVLAALAAGADLTLTSDQEEAALAIIRSLPRDATIRDVVDACDQHAAILVHGADSIGRFAGRSGGVHTKRRIDGGVIPMNVGNTASFRDE